MNIIEATRAEYLGRQTTSNSQAEILNKTLRIFETALRAWSQIWALLASKGQPAARAYRGMWEDTASWKQPGHGADDSSSSGESASDL